MLHILSLPFGASAASVSVEVSINASLRCRGVWLNYRNGRALYRCAQADSEKEPALRWIPFRRSRHQFPELVLSHRRGCEPRPPSCPTAQTNNLFRHRFRQRHKIDQRLGDGEIRWLLVFTERLKQRVDEHRLDFTSGETLRDFR